MHPVNKFRFGCAIVVFGLGAAVALIPVQTVIWDGGFPNLEAQLTFVDGQDRPVPGVQLTVLTRAGGPSHFYPVDEFLPDQSPVSDAEGQMVFHHTAAWLEFSGRYSGNLLGMRFGETFAPQYECVFHLKGREVFRTPFNFHRREWESLRQPSITRTWQPPYLDKVQLREDEELKTWKLRLFDGNADGRLDREEMTAAITIERNIHPEEKPAERMFEVVKRKIVVPAG